MWDIVYNDIDKDGYPAVVDLAHAHLRPGGLFITDNVIWSGRVLDGEDDGKPATAGVKEFTRRLFAHRGFLTSINPTRDGVAVAIKALGAQPVRVSRPLAGGRRGTADLVTASLGLLTAAIAQRDTAAHSRWHESSSATESP